MFGPRIRSRKSDAEHDGDERHKDRLSERRKLPDAVELGASIGVRAGDGGDEGVSPLLDVGDGRLQSQQGHRRRAMQHGDRF